MAGSSSPDIVAISELFDNGGLPLNRKEVYFTATVLPGIICADNFAYFGKFLDLLKIKGLGEIDAAKIQFFSEYSFASTIDDEDSGLADFEGKHQQPDLLILIEAELSMLIVVEAKMYSPATKSSLVDQMESQEKEIWYWIKAKKRESRIVHAALLPEQMMPGVDNLGECEFPHSDKTRRVISWENIAKEFINVSSAAYFVGVLKTALAKYPHFVGKGWDQPYCDAELSGVEIVAAYIRGERRYQMMGRQGGLAGALQDVAAGKWLTRSYQVKESGEQRPRWFRISEFVELITKQPQKDK